MHFRIPAVISLMLLIPAFSFAQENAVQEKTPEGWQFIPLPVISYNSDLGLHLGANLDIYDYGRKPSLFPDYLHKFRLETSYFFGGRSMIHASYDSEHLIPGVRIAAVISWQKDPLYNFYGFGGDVVTYDRSQDLRNGVAYYSHGRDMARIVTVFQGKIVRNFNWVAGLSVSYYDTYETISKKYDGENSLYHFYRQTGVIGDDEIKGWIAEIKAGANYDTRDFEPAPTKGICADVYLNASPDIFRTGYAFAKLCAHFRHYITPGPDWFTLAYHLAYQGTVAGKAPFFIQQNIYSLVQKQSFTDGLGGQNTIRGVAGGRLVGDGYAWANFEARFRLFKFKIAGMDFFVATNPFYDIGAIVQPYKLEEISKATGESLSKLKELSGRLHQSAGLGFKLGMDKNYILSLEIAKAFNRNDGPLGIATSINYIF